MLPTDAFFWYAEAATPELRPLVAGLFLLDRVPDRARFRASIENLVFHFPRFRQRVVEPTLPFGMPEWKTDSTFDLDYHLRDVILPGPATQRHLLEYASGLFSAPLDHMRPLWEGHLIEGLQDGRAAFLLKLHHSVADGVGSVAMLDAFTQRRRGEPVPRHRRPAAQASRSSGSSELTRLIANGFAAAGTTAGRIALAGARVVRDPAATGEQLARNARALQRMWSDLMAPKLDDPLAARSTGIGRRLDGVVLPLPRMKRLKTRLSITLNDLVLTAVSGAIGRYHEHHRLSVDQLACMVPMNLRREHERHQLGNRVGAFYVSLPVAERDPIARLQLIREQTTRAKGDRQGAAYQTLMQAAALIPAAAFRAATRSLAGRVHVICSNVPGPPRQTYLAGAKIDGVLPFAPVMLGTPLSIALASYGPTYGIGIDSDPAAIPDPERIGRGLVEEVDRIERAAARATTAGAIRGPRRPTGAIEAGGRVASPHRGYANPGLPGSRSAAARLSRRAR
jgi:WS/DGAT/MGAT family acyltransferase